MEAKSLTTDTAIKFVPADFKIIGIGATCDDALL